VGALSARKVDVRVLAATTCDLRAAIAEKRFREDLYYRLSMVEIQSPSLAERKEDLPLLQHHFVSRYAAQYRKKIRGITHRAQIRLSRHSWPGNVRELENVVGHAAMMAPGEMIDTSDLPPYLQASSEQAEPAAAPRPGGETLAEVERAHIIHVLRETGGVISAAAVRLDVPRTTLNALMRRLEISRDDI
jgi:DNA-binding NtrC family response regulator